MNRLTPAVFGKPLPDFPTVKAVKIEPAKLKRYEGMYLLPSGEKLVVEQRGNLLSIDAEGQAAINLLAFSDDSAAQIYANLNSRAAAIAGGVFKGNYEALKLELKDAAKVERWQRVFERWQKEWQEKDGKFADFEILGTVPSERETDGTATTFVRVKSERGSKVFYFYWQNDKLFGLGRGGIETPATTFAAQSETDFVGYNLGLANTVRLAFDLSPSGEVTGLRLIAKNGEADARKA